MPKKDVSAFVVVTKKKKVDMNRINFELEVKHRDTGLLFKLSHQEVYELLNNALNARLKEQQQFVEIDGISGITKALVLSDTGDALRIKPLELAQLPHPHFVLGSMCSVQKKYIGSSMQMNQCCQDHYSTIQN